MKCLCERIMSSLDMGSYHGIWSLPSPVDVRSRLFLNRISLFFVCLFLPLMWWIVLKEKHIKDLNLARYISIFRAEYDN